MRKSIKNIAWGFGGICTAALGVGALATTLKSSAQSYSLREKPTPVHDVRFVEFVKDEFFGSVYMLPVVDDHGVKSLALAHPTQVVSADSSVLREGPIMIDDNQKWGGRLIETPEIVDFLVGDRIGDVDRESVRNSYIDILRPERSKDSGWNDQFSVHHISNVPFMGRYSDITELHRPDSRGDVRFIDQGRDGLVDYVHLNGYFGNGLRNELLDLNTSEFNLSPCTLSSQQRISNEKDKLVRLVEAKHHQCSLKYDGCKHNTENQ